MSAFLQTTVSAGK